MDYILQNSPSPKINKRATSPDLYRKINSQSIIPSTRTKLNDICTALYSRNNFTQKPLKTNAGKSYIETSPLKISGNLRNSVEAPTTDRFFQSKKDIYNLLGGEENELKIKYKLKQEKEFNRITSMKKEVNNILNRKKVYEKPESKKTTSEFKNYENLVRSFYKCTRKTDSTYGEDTFFAKSPKKENQHKLSVVDMMKNKMDLYGILSIRK